MGSALVHNDLFLSYYGDDFTGSADVMESLTFNGIPAALFLEPPTIEEVERFRLKLDFASVDGKIKAFGVAGVARSMSPGQMDEELPPIFEQISKIPADFFQYKACSTFDSAPHIGNIGHAAEIASRYFKTGFIPLVIGAPFLNRFVVFGNLFARVGEDTFRLDRHPTMSKHPVTPMNESDLRRHLGLQTERKVQLMDLFALEGEYGKVDEYFDQLTTTEGDFVLFDTLTRDHMMVVGELLLEKNIGDTQFLVGASGMNHAMAFCLQQRGLITPPQIPKSIGAAQHMVVITGSCAPGTATQVGYMKQRGHEAFKIDTGALVNQESSGSEVENCVSRALHAIERGSTPVLYAALGPDDPSIGETEQAAARLNVRAGELIAERQGQMAFEIANKVPHLRVGIAGGDTSGYVSRALGIYALEAKCPIAPGAPLCVAHSRNPQFDGMEITLKGGQNGNEKFFEYVLRGQVHD